MSNSIHPWLYSDTFSGKFLMLPPELYEEPAFQALTPAARDFYVMLNVHKETEIQRSNLKAALIEYTRIFDLGMTAHDIECEATPNKKTSRFSHGYFVIPQKHFEAYGYKKNYVTKLKRQLIDAGFIKKVYGGKGRYGGWNNNETIYQFCNDWKSKPSTP